MAKLLSGNGTVYPTLQERPYLLKYLADAPTVIIAAGLDVDRIDQSNGQVVPIGLATDGKFVWQLDVPYYVETHDTPVDAELLQNARQNGFEIPEITERQLETIRAEICDIPTGLPPETDDLPHENGFSSPFG